MALLAGLLTGLAVLALHRPADGRLHRVLRPGRADAPARSPARTDAPDRSLAPGRTLATPAVACVVAGAALAVLLAAPLGPVVGLAVALAGPRVLSRLEPAGARAERERLAADLPLLLDLLSSCLAAGASLPQAAAVVAPAVPGPAGDRLADVAAQLAVGTPPAQAWAGLTGGGADDPLAPAARALGRAAEGGAPVAAAVARLAADARARARSRGEQAARRVGVVVVAPLGLCFLPAFVLIGVVPVVAGLVGPLLRSL